MSEKRTEKLKNREYRKAFVASHLNINIPYQIRALRKARGWEQSELAEKAGMAQPSISRLEKPGYGKTNLDTLLRLANAFDVALVVRFAAFSDLVRWNEAFSPDGFDVSSYDQDCYLSNGNVSHAIPTPSVAQEDHTLTSRLLWSKQLNLQATQVATTTAQTLPGTIGFHVMQTNSLLENENGD